MAILEESRIETLLREAIKKEGGRAYKFVSPGNAGVPDRIVFLPNGKIIFLELKKHGKKPTALQKAQRKKLESLGQTVRVATGIKGLAEFLEEFGMNEQADRIRRAHKDDL